MFLLDLRSIYSETDCKQLCVCVCVFFFQLEPLRPPASVTITETD